MASSSPSSIIANNFDLLQQILLSLPAKSLLIFKSVSKQWLSLISDPNFSHYHYLKNHKLYTHGLILHKFPVGLSPSPRPHRTLITVNPAETSNPLSSFNFEYEFISLDGKSVSGSVPFKSLRFVKNPSKIRIRQSCNGLLCFSTFLSFMEEEHFIYNPLTNQCCQIINDTHFKEHKSLLHLNVSLAFDPLKSPYYEVVSIWTRDPCPNKRRDSYMYQIEIYSSKTSSWRVSTVSSIDVHPDTFLKNGVFWNGSLHWINRSGGHRRGPSIYFNMNQETVMTMPMSPIRWNEKRTEYFGECKGHLHLIEIYAPSMAFDIFEMDTDYTGWYVKYRVNLDSLAITYPEMVGDNSDAFVGRLQFSVLLVEEDEESSRLVLEIPEKVLFYDIKEMTITHVHDLSQDIHKDGFIKHPWFDAYQYIETLTHV